MDDGHINYDDAGFEKEDLSRLIEKTVNDLQTVDNQRKQEFKQYEVCITRHTTSTVVCFDISLAYFFLI